jgi:hypothetical protein
VGDQVIRPGYFSLLRWRSDATRDEARNVAVVLVDAEGTIGGLRATDSVASISPHLAEQGLLDTLVQGLQVRLEGPEKPDLAELRRMHISLQESLYLTEPAPCAVVDVEQTLNALFKAYVKRPSFPGGRTKGKLLVQIVQKLRAEKFVVTRDTYVDDFQFDALVRNGKGPVAMNALTFAQAARKDWKDAEYDASHFIFSIERTHLPGVAVLEAPREDSPGSSQVPYERVNRWFSDAGVPVLDPDAVIAEPRLVIESALGATAAAIPHR